MIRLTAMRRVVLFVLLVGFLLIGAALPARSDGSPATAMAAAPSLVPQAPSQPPAPALTPGQAQQVLEVLTDPKKRDAFVAVLESMARAAPAVAAPVAPPAAAPPAAVPATAASASAAAPAATAPAATPATAAPAAAPAATAAAAAAKSAAAPSAKTELPIPLAPDSLGAEILVGASHRLSGLSGQVIDMARVVTGLPLIERWLVHLVRSREVRVEMIQSGWRLLVVMVAAVAAERALVWLLRPMVQALAARAPDPLPPREHGAGTPAEEAAHRHAAAALALRRLPFLLARLAFDVLPLLLLAAIGYGLLGTPLGERETARLVILAVLNAYLLTRVIVIVTRALLAPNTPRLRLLPVSDATAIFLTQWVRRIALIGTFGYAFAEVGLLFGLYRVAHDAILKLVVLAVHLCLVVIVLQTRRRVAEVIRGRPAAIGAMANARKRFAAIWHVIAIFYIVALWLVWAFQVPNGYQQLIRIFVSTLVIGTLARLAVVSANGAADHALRVAPDLARRYPGLEARTRRYRPIGHAMITGVIGGIAIVVLFQVWGIDSFSWFSGDALGGRLVGALVSIGLTLLVSLGVWELANAAMQRRLERTARGGQAARMRTLLPMLRTMLFVAICIVAGFIVLSEIGVNVAPLLAGAGVIGIAIGFGSQKLVQDFITGIFLLFENAMQVGDWVTVSSLSGTVEHLSIRTIRLRAADGSVHIIPFSAVTSVTNVNRGIGNASVNVVVDIREDIDRVFALLGEIASGMRAEKAFAAGMISDLQLWGVDKVEAGGATIVGQIVCTDAARWNVQREFNRRLQRRFAELGIRFAMPVQRTVVEPGETAPGAASPSPSPGVERAGVRWGTHEGAALARTGPSSP